MPGRKSRYETRVASNLDRISGWIREGVSEVEVCRKLGVGRSTFARYKDAHAELAEALRVSREDADRAVENEFFRNCTGYETVETHIENPGTSRAKTTIIKKRVAGNVSAQIFWLTNRRRDRWKRIEHIEATVNEDLEMAKFRLALDKMSEQDVRSMLLEMGETTE